MLKKRVQSPSSILCYKQCPRKYYYQYIENRPSLPNIHQIRGNVAHAVLENFFDIALPDKTNYEIYFKEAVQKLLLFYWRKAKSSLEKLNLSEEQKKFYFEETLLMLMNWVTHFLKDLNQKIRAGFSLEKAFQKVTPLREQKYFSKTYSVQGFIDAIYQSEEGVYLIDYKTNACLDISEEQILQLAIYCLLYYEKHKELPFKLGIFFLRHKLKLFKATPELLYLARKEIQSIHQKTSSREIKDYPPSPSPLCKYSSGQCDYYEICCPDLKNLNNSKGSFFLQKKGKISF